MFEELFISATVTLLLILSVCSLWGGLYLVKYYQYWEKRGVPVEERFILVNRIYDVFSGKIHFGTFLSEMYTHHDGPYFGFYILGKPYLFIRSPEIIKTISIRDFHSFANRSFFCDEHVDPVVAKSVFLAQNTQWKSTRTRLNVLFSPAKVKSMVPTITEVSMKMQEYLETCDNEIVDFTVVAENLITNLGPLIFLGINSHCSFDKPDNTVKDSIKNIFGKGWYQGVSFFSYCFLPKLVPVLNLKLGNYEFLKDAIQQMINYKEKDTVRGKEIADLLVNNKLNSNDKNENYYDENWLISQALTFILAGFVPPTSLFSFTLYEMSLNPDCQEKLRKEINQTFPGDTKIIFEKVIKMKYLNMVICETLRRNPLGGFINRMCSKDYVMEETGLKIAKGTPVLMSVDAIHSDPNYYPNPKKFDPERFKDGTKDLENAGLFIPFGTGQRRCIGEKFTQTAVRMSIVYLLRKFRFEPCYLTENQVIIDPKTISSSPLNGIKLRIHKL